MGVGCLTKQTDLGITRHLEVGIQPSTAEHSGHWSFPKEMIKFKLTNILQNTVSDTPEATNLGNFRFVRKGKVTNRIAAISSFTHLRNQRTQCTYLSPLTNFGRNYHPHSCFVRSRRMADRNKGNQSHLHARFSVANDRGDQSNVSAMPRETEISTLPSFVAIFIKLKNTDASHVWPVI